MMEQQEKFDHLINEDDRKYIIDLDIIVKCTGLSKEEIQAL